MSQNKGIKTEGGSDDNSEHYKLYCFGDELLPYMILRITLWVLR